MYGGSARQALLTACTDGELTGGQIVRADIDGLCLNGARWNRSDMTDTNANETRFDDCGFCSGTFTRSSLMHSRFTGCRFDLCALSGLTLIKTGWSACILSGTRLDSCTLQRAELDMITARNCVFNDFEGVMASVSGSIFYDCRFVISYGSGMNGFSGARLQNCLFKSCSFMGWPLRGSILENCVFTSCTGEIADDANLTSVCAIKPLPLENREEARAFLCEYVLEKAGK